MTTIFQVMELIMKNLETGDLLSLRSTSVCWNELSQRLLRLRIVYLDRKWTKRADGMRLFDVFDGRKGDFLPWSACVFDVNMQLMPAFYYKFFKEFGTRIKSFEVQEFAEDFNLLSILHLMPNLEQLNIPKLKKKIANLYHNTPVLQTLSKLKFVRIVFGNTLRFNARFLQVLLSAAPALSHLDLQNFYVSKYSNLDDIAALLVKLPSITLKVNRFDDDEAFAVLTKYKLKIKHLSMTFGMTEWRLRENFSAAFYCLESLHMIIRSDFIGEENCIILRRIFPVIPTLKTISIFIEGWRRPEAPNFFEGWRRPEAHSAAINLIVPFESEIFQSLATITVSSPRFAPIEMTS